MKKKLFLFFLFVYSVFFFTKEKIKINQQDTDIKALVVPVDTNSKKILVKDTVVHIYNTYRGLLNDDPVYNKREPIYSPILKVVAENVWLLFLDRYIFDYD